ncbi:MAG TPA: cation diffusion facilitator family transporter, partial [Candidatus Binatia bacterium]|nr:cation diffusion facilitator family transporter [Candidatus Binatia bacterium]
MRSHSHEDGSDHDRGHQHDVVDPSITTSERGIWAIKWSFVGLLLTAIFQAVIVWLSGSVALLADTIHNFGDAATAIPLWVAFAFSRRKANRRFTYGYGRVEDLAGVAIVVTIAFSALIAGYEAVQRLLNPQPIEHLWAVVAASIIGFLGNEEVAIFRTKVGREIHSAALVADGHHARVDGWTSLAVLVGAVGVWLGFPVADPIVGLLIAVAIARIVWQSSKAVFGRMLEAVDPEIVDEIHRTASDTTGVEEVTDVRARWLGHRLTAELNVAVASRLSVSDGHAIAKNVRHELLHRLN